MGFHQRRAEPLHAGGDGLKLREQGGRQPDGPAFPLHQGQRLRGAADRADHMDAQQHVKDGLHRRGDAQPDQHDPQAAARLVGQGEGDASRVGCGGVGQAGAEVVQHAVGDVRLQPHQPRFGQDGPAQGEQVAQPVQVLRRADQRRPRARLQRDQRVQHLLGVAVEALGRGGELLRVRHGHAVGQRLQRAVERLLHRQGRAGAQQMQERLVPLFPQGGGLGRQGVDGLGPFRRVAHRLDRLFEPLKDGRSRRIRREAPRHPLHIRQGVGALLRRAGAQDGLGQLAHAGGEDGVFVLAGDLRDDGAVGLFREAEDPQEGPAHPEGQPGHQNRHGQCGQHRHRVQPKPPARLFFRHALPLRRCGAPIVRIAASARQGNGWHN